MRYPLIALALCAMAATATAQPRPTRTTVITGSGSAWDSRGFVRLGGQSIERRRDADVIRIPVSGGRYDRLTFVVDDAELDVNSIVVRSTSGRAYAPAVRHSFHRGNRTLTLELPPGDREVRSIEIRSYRSRAHRGARIEAWGMPERVAYTPPRPPPPPPPPPRPVYTPPNYAAQGWVLLGEQWVSGRGDHDTIQVGRKQGTWTKLMLAVDNGDLRLDNLTVTFGNGTKQTPQVRHFFREGSRSVPIDLQGVDRAIDKVDLRYGNVNARDGRARVQLWAMPGDGRPTGDPRGQGGYGQGGHGHGQGGHGHGGRWKANWDRRGWIELGNQEIGHRRDRDVIDIGKRGGAFQKVMLVVEDGDAEIHDIVITFGDGEKWSPPVRHYFRENDRTRAIDLPGRKRFIQRIEFVASNVGRGEKANIKVYGQGDGKNPGY